MGEANEYEILDFIFRLVIEKYSKLEEEFPEICELGKLSYADRRAVLTLGHSQQERMSGLAKHLGLTVGTLTTTIDRLVKKGFVQRNRVEEDRRVVEVRLSDMGIEAFQQLEANKKLLAEKMFNRLSAEEQQSLREILIKLLNQ